MADPALLQGIKIAIPGAGAELAIDLGASPISMSTIEYFAALQTGVIDAVATTANFAESSNLDAASQLILAFPDGKGLLNPFSTLVINQQVKEALPADLVQLLQDTTGPALSYSLGASFLASHEVALASLARDSDAYGLATTTELETWEGAATSFAEEFSAALSSQEQALRTTYLAVAATAGRLIAGVDNPTVAEWSTGPYAVLIPEYLGVTSVMQLDGATIALPTGTAQELSVNAMFRQLGISYEPVPVETYSEAVQQFLAGAADVMIVPMSFVGRSAVSAGGDDVIALQDGFTQSGDVIDFVEKFIITGTDAAENVNGSDAGELINAGDGGDWITCSGPAF